MEVVQMEEKTPSWLSIITKAKRFDVNVHDNSATINDLTPPATLSPRSSPWGQGQTQNEESTPKSCIGHPKKTRRHRIPSSRANNDDEDGSHPPKKVHINVVDLPGSRSASASSSSGCSSVSSSPSPGLLSCGSSAEEESTSTSILSAFSSTSSSPRHHQFPSSVEILPHSTSYHQNNLFQRQDGGGLTTLHPGDPFVSGSPSRRHPHHPHNFHDFRERLPEISISPLPQTRPSTTISSGSNQISVIKSTRGFLGSDSSRHGQSQHQVYHDDCCNSSEEPQDLSLKPKPKRFITASGYASTTHHKAHAHNNTHFSHRESHDGNDLNNEDCVQDLSLRPRVSSPLSTTTSLGNKNIPPITILPLPRPTPSIPSTSNNSGPTTITITNSPQTVDNNLTGKGNELAQINKQPVWKAMKLSSLISPSDSSAITFLPSKSKFKPSEDSTSSSVSSLSTISLSSNSNSSSHCNSNKISANVRDDEGDGELVIADVDFKSDNTALDKRDDSEESHNNDIQEKLPVGEDAVVKSNEKFHDLKNDSSNESSSSPTKETHGETEFEVEVEVKGRRGRKRKDEEAIGTRFDCFLCSFTGVKENVLRNHMIRMHTVKGNRGNVKCTVCGYACPSVEELRSHQELIHMQDSKADGKSSSEVVKVAFHACHHCTKKFRSQSQLDAHLRLIAQKQLWKDLKTRRMMN